jgi:integrase
MVAGAFCDTPEVHRHGAVVVGRPHSREHIGRIGRRATRAAGLRDFNFHDLRHHGATMALNKGSTARPSSWRSACGKRSG